jgi:hypothetical protein
MTAFPTAAIAFEMAHGFGQGQSCLSYEDVGWTVDYDLFTKHLKTLGIEL